MLILNSRLLEVFPFLRSIREMCCIISMSGHDAHMNAYQTHIEVPPILCFWWWIVLWSLQPKNRVDKWTHEPRYDFYHKKHLSIASIILFYFQQLIISKIQKYFIYLQSLIKTEKQIYYLPYYLVCIILLPLL